MRYAFRIGATDEANALVIAHHYSKRAPANVQWVGTWHEPGGLFGDYGPAVAACFFSIPPTRWSEPVLELTRLVRAPSVSQPLTGLISATCAHIRKAAGGLLVSFADKTQGHHGGIYQAASWRYAGARKKRIDGILINGKFVNCRQCRHLYGSSFSSLDVFERERFRVPFNDVVPHFDEGKHLYWRALDREGEQRAARLGLKALPYPKPARAEAA